MSSPNTSTRTSNRTTWATRWGAIWRTLRRTVWRGAGRDVWRDRAVRRWLYLYAVLNVLDVVETAVGLHLGGREASPLYAALFTRFPFTLVVALKLCVAALIAGYALLTYRWWRMAALVQLAIICAAFLLIVASNSHSLVTLLLAHHSI